MEREINPGLYKKEWLIVMMLFDRGLPGVYLTKFGAPLSEDFSTFLYANRLYAYTLYVSGHFYPNDPAISANKTPFAFLSPTLELLAAV